MTQSKAPTVADYLAALPAERRAALQAVLGVVRANLPAGYEETMAFGMIAWVVPLARYPKTYNGQPLMYAALASQKNHMAVYLTNIYADGQIAAWFAEAWQKTGKRMDVGKSCVRFRKLEDLPLDLVGKAIARTPVDAFIVLYEKARAGTKRG